MKPLLSLMLLLVLFFRSFSANATVKAAEPERFTYEEPHMGTKFRIVAYAQDRSQADVAAKAAFARIAQLNTIMSDYLPSSELMQLCKKNEKEIAGPIVVSEELFFVLEKAKEVSVLSEGAFDVTVGPIVRLWRVARRTQKLPDEKELADAKSKVGYRHVELDANKRSVKLLVPGMQLDLGGIAKGYAADEALNALAKHGCTVALVAAGGDISVRGAPPGTTGWKIDIAPLPGTTEKRTVRLKDASISTSGDAEQFVVIDGIRYSHIVDPRTGLGLRGRSSVTVIAPKGIQADSMTKMASILPAEKALAIIEKIDGTATFILRKTDAGEESHASKQFSKYLEK